MIMRYALVAADAAAVSAYLPENYQVLGTVDRQAVIGGREAVGWTLDAYVIPRLPPGFTSPPKSTLSHPVFKQLPA